MLSSGLRKAHLLQGPLRARMNALHNQRLTVDSVNPSPLTCKISYLTQRSNVTRPQDQERSSGKPQAHLFLQTSLLEKVVGLRVDPTNPYTLDLSRFFQNVACMDPRDRIRPHRFLMNRCLGSAQHQMELVPRNPLMFSPPRKQYTVELHASNGLAYHAKRRLPWRVHACPRSLKVPWKRWFHAGSARIHLQ